MEINGCNQQKAIKNEEKRMLNMSTHDLSDDPATFFLVISGEANYGKQRKAV